MEGSDFPGGEMVGVEVNGWFRTKMAQRAAWPVHTYRYIANKSGMAEHESQSTIWLLSDGTLAIGTHSTHVVPFDAEWFAEHEPDVACAVRSELRQRRVEPQ